MPRRDDMPITEIDVVNRAISLLGGKSVDGPDDSLEYELGNRFSIQAQRYCLESRDWTFASSYTSIAAEAIPAESEFANSFVLPIDCLVVRAVTSDPEYKCPVDYQVGEAQLFADPDTVYVRFTKDNESYDEWPDMFMTAVIHKLAELMAPGLTGDKSLKRSYLDESESYLEQGGAVNGMQGTPRRNRASILLNARYRYAYGTRYGLTNKL